MPAQYWQSSFQCILSNMRVTLSCFPIRKIRMDLLTFISKMVEALAWPVLIGCVLFVVKDRLPDIVASIRTLKYKGVEMTFGSEVKAVAAVVQHVLPAWEAAALGPINLEADVQHRIENIADYSPRGAILEAWLRVEKAAADVIVNRKLGNMPRFRGPQRLATLLYEGSVFDKEQAKAFDSLRHLRNEVVHVTDAQFTPTVVTQYIESAGTMAAYLESRAAAP